MGKRKSSGYAHKHNHNPRAHGSIERAILRNQSLAVTKAQKAVDRQQGLMQQYLPPEILERKKQKIGKNELPSQLHTETEF